MSKNSGTVRKGAFLRELKRQDAKLGYQVAEIIESYHSKFVEPRLLRIERVLFPLRLYDLAKLGVKLVIRWVKSKFSKPS